MMAVPAFMSLTSCRLADPYANFRLIWGTAIRDTEGHYDNGGAGFDVPKELQPGRSLCELSANLKHGHQGHEGTLRKDSQK